MKKILLLTSLFLVSVMAMPAEKTTIIKDILNEYAIQKVEYLQGLIKFSDAQAKQLKEIELDFLLDVQKAENSFLCNKQKNIEKLKKEKYQAIEKILSRDEYIKYKAVDNKEIKKHPLWAD